MNSKTITKNSFWYGIETFANLFLTLFTSIVIARAFGPEKLGYFLYLVWIAGIAGALGGLGIPAATRKYVSEYFGRDQMGIAKTVFYHTLWLQTLMAAVITLVGLVGIVFFEDRQYRTIGLLLIGSVFPFMVNSIAAGANAALEDLRANVPASLVSTGIFVISVYSSIYYGWGLLGISIGILAMRTAELVVRFIPLVKRFNQYSADPLDQILGKRMFLYSGQSLILLLLGLIVWDRSEMIVLKNFCADIRQVTFYSVAFNLTERLLVFSQVFGTATGATMMVQYGRDSSRVREMAETSARYLALISFPIHLGLAAIAVPLVWITYGSKYSGAIPAIVVASCLGIPKAFFLPVQAILSSWERQDLIIRWGVVSAALNLILDFALIPKYGAIGAAFANGGTQTFLSVALWMAAVRLLNVRFPVLAIAKTAVISAVMAVIVYAAISRLPALLGLTLAVILGAAIYLVLVRVTRVLDPADHGRLLHLKSHIPSSAHQLFEASLNRLIATTASSVHEGS
jgi:O-antigen/teichoic acid export membrane protein